MGWTRRFLILAALTLASLVPASAQQTETRVALVIGNGAYQAVQRLDNPLRDAAVIQSALARTGFAVDLRTDLTKTQLELALRDFSRKAARADVALIYYAGHGIQLEQENWLIPVGARLKLPTDARSEAVRLEDVIAFLESARRLRIVVLDACRDNPFSLRFSSAGRAVRRGLAPIEGLPGGTVVAFAAGPGQQASDRPNAGGANSPYAAALARRMLEPGVELSQVLRRVRGDVLRDAAPQEPWANESRLDEDFYFVPVANAVSGPAQPTFDPRAAELAYWNFCCTAAGADAQDFEGYLVKVTAREFPGTYADAARRRAQALRNPPVTRPPPPASTPAVAVPTPTTQAMTPGRVFRDCADVCPEMVVIPAGSFVMGKPSGETAYSGYSGAEEPQRNVRVQGFAAGKYEVTRGEWSAFVNATGRATPAVNGSSGTYCVWNSPGYTQDDRHPVACVNWQDAQAYALWLSQKTGQTYRLLTEAEWEYAARANTTTAYWFGGAASPRNANYSESGNNGTVRVGTYAANPFGLYDVSGNLWEWTEDCWHDNYNGAPSDGSAWTTGTSSNRVSRGGSWLNNPAGLRSADRYRSSLPPSGSTSWVSASPGVRQEADEE